MRRIFIVSLCWILTCVFRHAFGQVSVIGDLAREKTVAPGEIYKGTIEVQNVGMEPEQVQVYQTDYLFSADGSNQYGEPGQMARSNASWIEFSPKQFVVPGQEKLLINYAVRVPNADTLAGTYWSMLMVEPVKTATPNPEKGKIDVIAIIRYGIQMICNIKDTGTRSIRFFDSALAREGDGLFLQVSLENNGQRMLKPKAWLQLWNENGDEVGKFEGNEMRTYPGTSVRHKIELKKVKPGNYKALLVADCGGEDVFGMNLTLQIQPPQ